MPDRDCVSLLADLDAGKPVQQEAAATLRRIIAERDEAVAARAGYEAGWKIELATQDDPDWVSVHLPGLKLYIVTSPSGRLFKLAAVSEQDAFSEAIMSHLSRSVSEHVSMLLDRYTERLSLNKIAMAYAVERFGMWTAPTANMEEALQRLRDEVETVDHLLTPAAEEATQSKVANWSWKNLPGAPRATYNGRYGDYEALVQLNLSGKWLASINGGYTKRGFDTYDDARAWVERNVAERVLERVHEAKKSLSYYGAVAT